MKKMLKRGFAHTWDHYLDDVKHNNSFYTRFASLVTVGSFMVIFVLSFFLPYYNYTGEDLYLILARYIYILSLMYPIYIVRHQDTRTEKMKLTQAGPEGIPSSGIFWFLLIIGTVLLLLFYSKIGMSYQTDWKHLLGQWFCYIALIWMIKKNFAQAISIKALLSLSFVVMILSQALLFEMEYILLHVFAAFFNSVMEVGGLLPLIITSVFIGIGLTIVSPFLVRLIYGITDEELDYEALADEDYSLND